MKDQYVCSDQKCYFRALLHVAVDGSSCFDAVSYHEVVSCFTEKCPGAQLVCACFVPVLIPVSALLTC